jgi:hypothetical protein
MSPSAEPLFPPRGERGYDTAGVETFPWPVTAGYEAVHHWMDHGQAVHAAWQLKDVWEGLLKFVATLAVADHMATAPAEDPRTRKLLDQLLKKGGLTDGDWAKLMEIALKDKATGGMVAYDIDKGEWKLEALIKVAVNTNILPQARADSIDQVLRDYRNFVHPKKEVKAAHPCREAEALMAKGAIDGVCNHLLETLSGLKVP